jgi:DNA-binding HxlR family transcriptional regulator
MKTPDQEQPTEMPEACATAPMGRAIRLIGDAWILLIIINLLRGPKRFNELRALMGHISSKTLIQRLRALEELGFVQRRAFLEIPPRVEYHLTEKGQEFGGVIAAIEQFAQKNLSALDAPCSIPDDLTPSDRLGQPSSQYVE